MSLKRKDEQELKLPDQQNAVTLTNPNETLREMKGELRGILRRDIQLQIKLAKGKSALVNAAPSQFRELILHLALDAQDAMPDGGALKIAAGNIVLDEDYAQNHPGVMPGDYVVLAIHDDGDAVRRKHRHAAPNRCEKGRGSSLAASCDFIAAGGHISISRGGGETIVRIYLKRAGKIPQNSLPNCRPVVRENPRKLR